jgi:hypothetical protein
MLVLSGLAIPFMLWNLIGHFSGIRIRLGPVISIRSGIGGRRHFNAASLRQPFVRRNGASLQLCAIQADGTVVTLAQGFTSIVEACSVEQELETALGIADAPVPGELDRRGPLVDTRMPLRATRLACPACSAPLAARDVQPAKGQAVCSSCGRGILLGGPAATGPRTLVLLPAPRAVVDRSREAFVVDASLHMGEADAVRRALVTVTTVAGVLGVLWALDATKGLYIYSIAALLWLQRAWLWVARQGNRVRIRIEHGVLHAEVGPLPPRTRRSIPVWDISQVFVRAQPKSVFTFLLPDGSDGYQLCACRRVSMAEFQVLPLVDRMIDLREARYLEEQIEEYLGIVDAPVSGEVEGKMLRHEVGAPSVPGSGNLSLPDASSGGELSVPRATGALSEPD